MTAYFCLVFALTAPFWVLGAFVRHELSPGLPIAAMAVVCPALAAVCLSLREGGAPKLAELLGRLVDFGGARRWLIPALLINPVLFGATFLVSRLFDGTMPLPAVSAASVGALLALFLLGAALEELGWSGYALGRLQARFRPETAALVLGVFWALWHIPALLQIGRSLDWIAWWGLWTILARLVMVWLYNWSGASLPAVLLFHASSNLCWQVYPVNGSYFDPRATALVLLAFVVALIIRRRATVPRRSAG